MSEAATKLLEQLLLLPEAERLLVADQLLESVGDAADDDPEFEAQLRHRLNSIADGTAELIDGERVIREARGRLRSRHQS